MSTRCLIGKENPDKTITYIYCHHDGCPSWMSKVLLNYYQNEEVIDKLLALGDMSCIGNYPVTRAWDSPWDANSCEPYSERGDFMPASTVDDEKEFFRILEDEEYWYLFKDNKWFYSNGDFDFTELRLAENKGD